MNGEIGFSTRNTWPELPNRGLECCPPWKSIPSRGGWIGLKTPGNHHVSIFALIATITVERDMTTAPAAGGRRNW